MNYLLSVLVYHINLGIYYLCFINHSMFLMNKCSSKDRGLAGSRYLGASVKGAYSSCLRTTSPRAFLRRVTSGSVSVFRRWSPEVVCLSTAPDQIQPEGVSPGTPSILNQTLLPYRASPVVQWVTVTFY